MVRTILEMIEAFLRDYPLPARPQEGEPTFFPRRTVKNCELDPDKTLREQFNKLRVLDNERYPARLVLDGHEYVLKIYKA
jgi:methionyl-tRNA formyltransferase